MKAAGHWAMQIVKSFVRMATFWQNLFCRPHNQENPDDLLEGMKYYPAIKGLYTRHFFGILSSTKHYFQRNVSQGFDSITAQLAVEIKRFKKTWGHWYIQRTNETTFSSWVFPKIGVPQNGWFMENPIKMDNLGVPLFSETSSWRKFGEVLQCLRFSFPP